MPAQHEVQKLRADLRNWQARLDEAEVETASLEKEAAEIQHRLSSARGDRDIYRKLTEGTEALLARLDPSDGFSETEPAPTIVGGGTATASNSASGVGVVVNGHGPRGREAILRVMRERQGDWEQMEIVRTIIGRGWIDANAKVPKEAIRVAVKRLVDRGDLERVRPGVVRFPATRQDLLNEERCPPFRQTPLPIPVARGAKRRSGGVSGSRVQTRCVSLGRSHGTTALGCFRGRHDLDSPDVTALVAELDALRWDGSPRLRRAGDARRLHREGPVRAADGDAHD